MKLEEQKKKFLDYLESRQREQEDKKQMEKSLEEALGAAVNRELSRLLEGFGK
ncbi:MAG: hypothetical protein IKY98_03865 [Alphaproteobacteria bacterium]|nr:hypothetical protein [Alphaproteobacteria bacterium]